MTTKNENPEENNAKNKTSIIPPLMQFHSALIELNSSLDKLLTKIPIDNPTIKKLARELEHSRTLWSLKDAKEYLPVIVFLAAHDKPQYIEDHSSLVRVTSVAKDSD